MKRTGEPINQFRIRREQQLFEHRFLVRATEAHKGVLRLIEDQEKMEVISKQVSTEMEDFFKDSTRLAARVFGSIEEREARKIELQVSREMEEFFCQLSDRVESLISALSKHEMPPEKVGGELHDLLNSPLHELEKVAVAVAKEQEQSDDQ